MNKKKIHGQGRKTTTVRTGDEERTHGKESEGKGEAGGGGREQKCVSSEKGYESESAGEKKKERKKEKTIRERRKSRRRTTERGRGEQSTRQLLLHNMCCGQMAVNYV